MITEFHMVEFSRLMFGIGTLKERVVISSFKVSNCSFQNRSSSNKKLYEGPTQSNGSPVRS